MLKKVSVFGDRRLNFAERIPVLNGNFPVKILDQDKIVPSAELIALEKYVPF
jgi:hypothetical protein